MPQTWTEFAAALIGIPIVHAAIILSIPVCAPATGFVLHFLGFAP